MHRSSNRFALIVLLTFSLSLSLLGQSGQSSQQSTQSQNQQQQQPVQDLTPPSDAEAERMAAPPPAPNQPTDSAKVPVPAAKPKSKDDYTFVKDVEEVTLYATVVDPKNHLVTNLDRNAFVVYEDGQPQRITSFRHDDVPVSMGILIDNSGSMRDKRPAVNQAALNLVRASNPQDELFVVNFNDDAFLDQDFTSNVELLREALERIEARGGTAVYDAVIAAANQLAKGAKLEKKALLVITDGEDNASRDTLEQAVKRVQDDAGPTVYTIGILGNDRESKRARRALERLSVETGGIAYFPKDLGEVDAISRAVAHDIRNQYTIGYKPTRPQSQGGFRNVRVEARGADGRSRLQVRTRSGYFAGQKRASNDAPVKP
ncbi:MAG: von Willebrand factor, type [Acidobacteriales bacterium]|nr:von Willebrand factor, type [Terriglobales bacterium]